MIMLRIREFDFDSWTEIDAIGPAMEDASSIVASWARRLGWAVEIFTADGEWVEFEGEIEDGA